MSESHTEAPATSEVDAATADETTTAADTATTETTTGAPESGHGTTDETTDFFSEKFDRSKLPQELQSAYNEMHGALTRARQQDTERVKQAEGAQALLADLQSEDPSDRQNALAWLAQNGLLTEELAAEHFGWEIEPTADEEPLDPNDPAAIRQEFESYRAQQEAEREQANQRAWAEQEDARINTELDELGNGSLSQRSRDLIFRNALAASQIGITEGIDIKRAFEEYEAEFTDRQRAWRDGKQTAQPVGAGGQVATEVPDNTHEVRVQEMMNRLQPGPQ